MAPPTLTKAEAAVLAAWIERPGTQREIADRSGCCVSTAHRCLIALRSYGLILAKPERLPEAQYSRSQRAAYRGLSPLERAILGRWDGYDHEPSEAELARHVGAGHCGVHLALQALRACGLLPERLVPDERERDRDREPDPDQKQTFRERRWRIRKRHRWTPESAAYTRTTYHVHLPVEHPGR